MAEKELPAEAAREGTGTGAGSGSGTRIGKRQRDRVVATMNIRNARVGGSGRGREVQPGLGEGQPGTGEGSDGDPGP